MPTRFVVQISKFFLCPVRGQQGFISVIENKKVENSCTKERQSGGGIHSELCFLLANAFNTSRTDFESANKLSFSLDVTHRHVGSH
jgi:hypothetical protein